MPLPKDHYAYWLRACARGNMTELGRLVGEGPWPDLVSQTPRTSCLILAAGNGHEEVCRRLLAHQPQLEARNDEEATPLLVAAAEGHTRIVGMLLAAGANPLAVDDQGRSALYHAARLANQDLVRMLLAQVPDSHVDQPTRDGKTALEAACHAVHGGVMQMLLGRGANPNHYNPIEGERVMRAALLLDNAVAVALLATHGARLGHMHNGESYLHTAVRQQCVATVRALLDAGANPKRQSRQRKTPGDLAEEIGFKDYARVLAEFQHDQIQGQTVAARGVRRVRL